VRPEPLPPSAAQAPVDGYTTYPLAGGLAITLPQTWHQVDVAAESRLRAAIDTVLPKIKDSLLQASLTSGKPVQFFNATDGDHPGDP
jgi:hypothetical protein